MPHNVESALPPVPQANYYSCLFSSSHTLPGGEWQQGNQQQFNTYIENTENCTPAAFLAYLQLYLRNSHIPRVHSCGTTLFTTVHHLISLRGLYIHFHCYGRPRWGSRTALVVAGCRRTPERLDRDYGKTPHACSSLAASWESSNG